MNTIEELKNIRERMISPAVSALDCLLMTIGSEETTIPPTEYDYPFTADTNVFIGKKPAAVMFGDERVNVRTWRDVYSAIIKRCNADAQCHDTLMNLRDKVAGRDRMLLSRSPDGMRRPLRIDDDMYAEACYGTGTLLYILRDRILAHTRFDYSDIGIVLKA